MISRNGWVSIVGNQVRKGKIIMNEPRKTRFIHFALPIVLLIIFPFTTAAAMSPPAEGAMLPTLDLPIPDNSEYRDYLGLTGQGSFQIPQIKARVVITEIYSLYCPYCQREAPLLNELYQTVEKDPNLKGTIKIIGIGAGNSPFEVQAFRETYKVPFPLFADEDFKAHKCLGETRTPYFIAIKINDDGTHKVIYSKLGSISAVEPFLKLITQLSGLGGGAK